MGMSWIQNLKQESVLVTKQSQISKNTQLDVSKVENLFKNSGLCSYLKKKNLTSIKYSS